MCHPPLFIDDLDLILSQTAPLWSEARGQALFLTGGTGFFGCWLLESFCHINRSLRLDARVTVLTRSPDAFRAKCPHLAVDPAITLWKGDICDFTFPPEPFRYIVHAATETSTGPTANAQIRLLESTVRGTERVLQFASTHNTQKLLLTSSGAVYGPQPSAITHLPETFSGGPDQLNIANAYGEGKRLSELLCALYGKQHSIECKIARCWAFCGPHLPLDKHFAIGNFIGDVLAGRPIRISGDGTPRRSYLYAADLVIWLWTILFSAPPLMPFNVGSDRDLSILELAQTVATALGHNVDIKIAKQAQTGGASSRYIPSVERAAALLGLQSTITLEDCIRRTAEWHTRRSIDTSLTL